jgi:hypothetical protein
MLFRTMLYAVSKAKLHIISVTENLLLLFFMYVPYFLQCTYNTALAYVGCGHYVDCIARKY